MKKEVKIKSTEESKVDEKTTSKKEKELNKKEEPKAKVIVKKKINKHLVILGVLILVLVAICIGAFCYSKMTNPTVVYKTIVKESLGNIIKIANIEKTDKKTNVHLDLSGFSYNMENKTVANMLDHVKLYMDLQTDTVEEKMVLKLKSTYDNEPLLDGNLYLDGKDKKIYIYAKDVIDKYLELDVGKYLEKINKVNNLTVTNKSKLTRILKSKVDELITDTMCTVENDAYVLRTTRKEVFSNLNTIFNDLKNDDNFLSCFEEPETVKKNIDEILKEISLEQVVEESYILKLTIDRKDKTAQLIIDQINNNGTRRIIYSQTSSQYGIWIRENDENVFSIDLFTNESDLHDFRIQCTFYDNFKGLINIKGNIEYTEIDEIEKVDVAKVKRFEDLSMFEKMGMLFGIKNPNLYKILLPLLLGGVE